MPLNSSTVWKLLGLAGVVGVAATGAVAVRAERQRRAYTPEEVRDRLHERYARVAAAADRTVVPLVPAPTTARARVRRRLQRGVRALKR